MTVGTRRETLYHKCSQLVGGSGAYVHVCFLEFLKEYIKIKNIYKESRFLGT